ncbi:MAG: GNAT family N-acetyltransferase [Alphaproteobacteria bacterium]|nr:GNAT family N-acetyltransferase [Alphaproteobacteria bacterium]
MFTTRALESDDWSVVEGLFGTNGACGGCWCMYWRLAPKDYEAAKGEGNRSAFRELVRSGRARGVLAFEGDDAVGWCAVGPREDFGRIVRHRTLGRDAAVGTWSVNCFFVPRAHRGRGVAKALLDAAVGFAGAGGASELEGYPVTPKDGKMPAAFAYTGVDAMFEGAGFAPLAREGRAIWVRAV